ncbi:hypothetical protein BH10ACI3_BH10ACI3_10040 [soil metagenome]
MKVIFVLTLVLILGNIAGAQTRAIAKSDFDPVISQAVRATNAAFPFIFTVITDTYENGKIVSTETDVEERQAQGVERETKTLSRGGKNLHSYSIMVGFGNNTYCSTDAVSWRGPQQFVCPGPDASGTMRLYRPRTPETAEYSVTEKSLKGQKVKVYREYLVFAPSGSNEKKEFREKDYTIDTRGFFISIIGNEGTLDPKVVTLTRTQTWDLKTKFKPVVAPK